MTASLVNVLRLELDAVNQQFFHILALRQWQEVDIAERITQVDNVDFANAMGIIDHLVETGATIELEPSVFSPGQDPASVLLSERDLEQRISRALDVAEAGSERGGRLLDTARQPRPAYREWLEARIEQETAGDIEPPADADRIAAMVASLVTLVELPMVHAFIHWHGGDRQAADAAWATSGAAMMHLTRLVRAFAKLSAMPYPSACPPLRIRRSADEALQSEQQLALRCQRQASAAAERCTEKSVAGACRLVAGFCAEFTSWNPSTPHPATATNPPCFGDFEATLKKFVN